jgi:hypothetical protein
MATDQVLLEFNKAVRPRHCLSAARQEVAGADDSEQLKEAFKEFVTQQIDIGNIRTSTRLRPSEVRRTACWCSAVTIHAQSRQVQ